MTSCDHHLSLVPECSRLLLGHLRPHYVITSTPVPLPRPLATTTPPSVTKALPVLHVLSQWNKTARGLLWPASLTELRVPKARPRGSECRVPVLFAAAYYSTVGTACVSLTHPFVDEHPGRFRRLATARCSRGRTFPRLRRGAFRGSWPRAGAESLGPSQPCVSARCRSGISTRGRGRHGLWSLLTGGTRPPAAPLYLGHSGLT